MTHVPSNYSSYTPASRPSMQFCMPSANEMHQLIEFCKIMASAPFYQKLGPGGVMAIYLTAKEHNLPFMSCLNGGMHTFDGKVTFSAQLINAMIINAGHRADVIHLDEYRCHLRFWRCDRRKGDGDTFDFEYTIEQAHKADYLKKANWRSSPKDMLFSRCMTGGGRKFIPEVFVGILVTGELVGDASDSNIAPAVPLHVQDAVSTKQIAPAATVKTLEHQPCMGFKEFVEKHGLVETEGGCASEKMRYVLETCKKANMSQIQVINAAISKEEFFEARFEAWKLKNPPQEVTRDGNPLESDNKSGI